MNVNQKFNKYNLCWETVLIGETDQIEVILNNGKCFRKTVKIGVNPG